jgi:hypothetical protein
VETITNPDDAGGGMYVDTLALITTDNFIQVVIGTNPDAGMSFLFASPSLRQASF